MNSNKPQRGFCDCNQGRPLCTCQPLEEIMNSRNGDVPASEEAIEKRIVEVGLTAPRIVPQQIDDAIVREDYHVFPGTTVTIALLELRNGFCVTGESAAASPENFNEQIGRDIARRNARDKIWSLEGYALRNRLSQHPPLVIADIEAAKSLSHQDRVRAEKDALDGNLSHLDAFIVENPTFGTLDTAEQTRLKSQAEAMRILSRILAARIDAFDEAAPT